MDIFLNIMTHLLSGFVAILVYKNHRKEKITYVSMEWIDIKRTPIPDHLRGFLLTDGVEIESRWNFKEYNKFGQAIMSYPERPVTHWMSYPYPPRMDVK